MCQSGSGNSLPLKSSDDSDGTRGEHNGSLSEQLEATHPSCVHCGGKLWFPGRYNGQMQPWCMRATCDGLLEDAHLAIQYLLSDEAMPDE